MPASGFFVDLAEMNIIMNDAPLMKPLKNLCIPVLLAGTLLACHTNTGALTAAQSATVRDSVQQLTEAIAGNVSHDGPVAWLRYFEPSPAFYMASEGKLVFPNIDSATGFINTVLIKNFRSIQLRWSDVRIDPYTPALAGIAAGYHEDITDTSGKTITSDGYFTGTAEKTSAGWQLRNAHWSSLPVK